MTGDEQVHRDGDGLRVLMTADTIGGVWIYALELMETLQASHIRFALATMGEPLRADQREAVERLPNVELFESDYRLEWMEEPWPEVAKAGRWLLEIERCWRPDVVHLNGYVHGSLPWKNPVLMVAHSCVYSWFAAVERTSPPAFWERYRRHVRRGLAGADLLAAPSGAMLWELQRHYGEETVPAVVIPNGREPGRFSVEVKQPYIFTAGRLWDEAKNILLLDGIAANLPWPTFAAGDCTDPGGRTVAPAAVRCLGLLTPKQIGVWLGQAGIYALPARYEPFGLSALEAGLSGCALVLSDIPSLRENWTGAALFAPPDQGRRWQELLTRLAHDRPLRTRMATAARRRALGFTSARMGRTDRKLYLSLSTKRPYYEDRSVLSFASFGLESRQRPFPARLRRRAAKAGP